MIILYGVLAICSGFLTAAFLWTSGHYLALIAGIFAGALAILGTAILHYVATTVFAPRKNLPGAAVHQPPQAEPERYRSP